MADLSCRIEKAQGTPTENTGLTVGEKFLLHCEGSVPAFDSASLEMRLDEADHYKLKLFGVNPLSSGGGVDLLVTSYVVGKHDLKNVQLVDAKNSVVLGNLRFQVDSVQDAAAPRKEPYPPAAPLQFFPWAFVFALVILLTSLLTSFFIVFARRRYLRSLLREIDQQAFQYAPVPEFYREVRQLQREHLFLTDAKASVDADVDLKGVLERMDRMFRVFLVRTYRIPAHRFSSAQFLRLLARRPEVSPELFELIRATLVELDRAREAVGKTLRPTDLEQLLRLMRKAVGG